MQVSGDALCQLTRTCAPQRGGVEVELLELTNETDERRPQGSYRLRSGDVAEGASQPGRGRLTRIQPAVRHLPGRGGGVVVVVDVTQSGYQRWVWAEVRQHFQQAT